MPAARKFKIGAYSPNIYVFGLPQNFKGLTEHAINRFKNFNFLSQLYPISPILHPTYNPAYLQMHQTFKTKIPFPRLNTIPYKPQSWAT